MMRILMVMVRDIVPDHRAIAAVAADFLILVGAGGMFVLVSTIPAWLLGIRVEFAMLLMLTIYGLGVGLWEWLQSARRRATPSQQEGGE